ncbi:HlyD family type I secretion periplasmic adaptor subunit [Allorhizobium sp. NPDC080224]|jgi:adhesin transport system membrane fusion protein|uniref:Membrane fusion protein (MFP) family protein n=1 Tax=Rhizobium rosettiformans TaxID=1368430 RepID=A0ABX7ETR6_9HYPH|nr:HlyD family type I secretion periplasmic adaptor subunit [Rhizobium rosettiformans]ODS51441.1 MAG: secretion protein HylD [Agrobacterium sp. SCN 61-19]QRF51717.1 HlyD family type I secretion periplasmic adaptor subunit [Rhizobium rosettiformans]
MSRPVADTPPFMARMIVVFVACFIVLFLAWAAIAEIDEIARGEGKVIPVSKTQIVQSSEAGVVETIAVQVGQIVRKGELIVQLNNTTTESSLGESVAKARALGAKIARLALEEVGSYDVAFVCPNEVQSVASQVCANEERLFAANKAAYLNKAGVLRERVRQRENELSEAQANIVRLEQNITQATRQYDLMSPLAKKGLVAQTELIALERELTDQRGQITVYQESLERLRGAVEEARLQVDELALQLRQQALTEKAQTLAELSVIDETIRGATDRVSRTDIRSPVDGIVNTLEVNTIGAYVDPGTVVAGIVPTADTLLIEAKISPRDVAFVTRGQKAIVKITAYDFSIFGGLEGEVTNISADSIVDKDKGETFYLVHVKTDQSELMRGDKSYPIIPGMVASAEIMTGRKTILSYLMKPINKAQSVALTER